MGNVQTDGPLSIYHQWRLGLINNAEVRQSWVSENIELSAINAPGGLKGIFLRDGQATYWVEYRRPSSNQSFNPGLVIYRSDPPPFQFIDTPLTDEVIVGSPGLGITTDMWMLNLDTYNYSQSGRATGSMTLAASKSATLFTGNITLSLRATTDSDKVMVAITRKSDTSPPPTPVIKDPRRWGSPDAEILESGFEVVHSTVMFPIDFFLLMGDVYIGNDEIGKAAHERRKRFEHSFKSANSLDIMHSIYDALATIGIGRELVIFVKNPE
jgi:hypothetical protein